MTQKHSNTDLLRRIVYAINKSVTNDVPEFLAEHIWDTKRCVGYFRSDKINANLRNIITSENVIFFPFQRGPYPGRIIIDKKNKLTYSISTFQNLRAIKNKKYNSKAHFLEVLLGTENKNLTGKNKQLSFYPSSTFDKASLEDEFQSIFGEQLNNEYTHYVIAYSFNPFGIDNIRLLLLDKDLDLVNYESLLQYIKPTFPEQNIPTTLNNQTPQNSQNTKPINNIRSEIHLKQPKDKENL